MNLQNEFKLVLMHKRFCSIENKSVKKLYGKWLLFKTGVFSPLKSVQIYFMIQENFHDFKSKPLVTIL